MILDYLERMRKEPLEVRRRAVFVWTVGAVALIASIYIGIRVVQGVIGDSPPPSSSIAAPYEAR